MSTVIEPMRFPAVATEAVIRAPRVTSIDIFRGLTMTLMIFVNELAGVSGLPWWNYHAPARIDAMTYVDMVFPAFLFIVGMTIPIALERRLQKSNSMARICVHIVLRTIALLILGLILANAEQGTHNLLGISPDLWTILALFGAILLWNVYGRSERYRILFLILRFSGAAFIVTMLLLFRRTTHQGHIAWLNISYPEILGLIGWTYLSVSILYLITRRWQWAPLVWFIALTTLCACTTARWISFPRTTPLYLWPIGNGAMASISMAGVLLSSLFLGRLSHRWPTLRHKITGSVAFALLSFLCGWLLTPLGISKIRATPTWCLYSIGSSVLCFMLLYWVCDVKRWTRWAAFAHPAGENTLLTYLLPDLYYFLASAVGFTYFTTHASHGLPGVIRCVVFTALILSLSALLTRCKLRLQL
jgi:heparan-alpha-glucosaminide N-acetyltransferase